jgi:hypothetical protein
VGGPVTKRPRFLTLFFLLAAPVHAASPMVGHFHLAEEQRLIAGSEALPFLASEINASAQGECVQGAFGMPLTASRDASPFLIELLRSCAEQIRQVAQISLERLTQRAATSDEAPSLDPAWLHNAWQTWWTSNSAAAPCHAHNDCSEKLRIDESS